MMVRVTLVCLSLLMASASVFAQGKGGGLRGDPDFLARLSDLDKERDLAPLFRLAGAPKTREQLIAGLDWMKWRALSFERRDPRYLISYAYLLYLANVKDTSAFAYLSGLLLARIEAARCADRSAPEPKIFQLEAETKFLMQNYWSFAPEKRQLMVRMALDVEETKSRGKPSTWLCSGGLTDQLLVLERAKNGNGPANATDVNLGNGTIGVVVDTSGVEPTFLPDEVFVPMRGRIREGFEKHFLKESPNPAVQGTLRDEAAQRP